MYIHLFAPFILVVKVDEKMNKTYLIGRESVSVVVMLFVLFILFIKQVKQTYIRWSADIAGGFVCMDWLLFSKIVSIPIKIRSAVFSV